MSGDIEHRDRFDAKFTQARALAGSMYGAGFDGFRTLQPEQQDNILWLLSDLLEEARQALREYEAG